MSLKPLCVEPSFAGKIARVEFKDAAGQVVATALPKDKERAWFFLEQLTVRGETGSLFPSLVESKLLYGREPTS
jgi:hypothetical protein